MSSISEMTNNVEVKKIAMVQDKNGYVLKLSINPVDVPEDILRDPVGSRYLMVLVRLNDQDEPVAGQVAEEANKAIKIASALSRDRDFQWWMVNKGLSEEPEEEATLTGLKEYLGIVSRKELAVNAAARRKLLDLRDEFADHYRSR